MGRLHRPRSRRDSGRLARAPRRQARRCPPSRPGRARPCWSHDPRCDAVSAVSESGRTFDLLVSTRELPGRSRSGRASRGCDSCHRSHSQAGDRYLDLGALDQLDWPARPQRVGRLQDLGARLPGWQALGPGRCSSLRGTGRRAVLRRSVCSSVPTGRFAQPWERITRCSAGP